MPRVNGGGGGFAIAGFPVAGASSSGSGKSTSLQEGAEGRISCSRPRVWGGTEGYPGAPIGLGTTRGTELLLLLLLGFAGGGLFDLDDRGGGVLGGDLVAGELFTGKLALLVSPPANG